MTRKITMELSLEDQQAVRAWQRSKASITSYLDEAGKIEGKNKRNQKSSEDFFRSNLRSMGQAALGFAGVGSAVAGIATAARLVLAEFENLKEKQAATSNSNLSFEQSLAEAIDNAKGIFTAGEVRSGSLSLAADAGVSPAKAARIIGSATTSAGVTNSQEAQLALDSAKAATIYAPYLDEASLEDFAGVTASTAKRFGISPEAAIGFSESGRAQSNVRNLGSYTANVSPVINNLTEFGATPREASALMAMLTQQMGDTTGEQSGTTAINFLKELRARFGGQTDYQRSDGSFDFIRAIATMQTSPEAQRRFFEGGEFFGQDFSKASLGKGKALPTLEGLLRSKDSVQSRQMSGSFYSISGFAESEQGYRQSVLDKQSVTPTEQARRILEAELGISQANDPTGVSAVLRELLPKYEQQLGTGALAQRFTSITRELSSGFGSDPVAAIESAQSQLSGEANRLRRGPIVQRAVHDIQGLEVHPEIRDPRKITNRQQQQIESIDRLVNALERVQKLVDVRVQVNNRRAEQADVRTPATDPKSTALMN